MAMPARIRAAMKAEGQTLDDLTKEVTDKTGNFDVASAPADNLDDDMFIGDDDYDAPAPATSGPTDAQPAAEGTDPPTADDPATTTPTGRATDTPAEPAEPAEPAAPAPATNEYVNPFDIGLPPEEPVTPQQPPAVTPQPVAAVPQPPAPAPTPAPALAPAPQNGMSIDVQLTEAEIQRLGGAENAKVLLGILSRFAQPLQSSIDQTQENNRATQRQWFRSGIASRVPQYREVVSSRAWQGYLNEYSPLSGSSVRDALMAADSRMDERAVLGIFKNFTDRFAAPAAQPTVATKSDGKPKPADLVTPDRSAISNGENQTGRNRYKYKESDIQALDDKRRRKKITSEQYADEVAKYEKALASGQVEIGA